MNLKDFDYDLPEKLIANRPPEIRGTSRLLYLNRADGSTKDDLYKNVAHYIRSNDLVVLNNTKVLPARILARTEEGKQRELLLLEKHGQQADKYHSLVIYRRTLRAGQQLTVGEHTIHIEQIFDNGTALIVADAPLWDIADHYGSMPLPPYMHRTADEDDKKRYQTVFAKELGSVAAPTASLNLTTEIIKSIKSAGAQIAELTLHVGLGTFMPIRTEDITEHKMHQEYFIIPPQTVRAIQRTKQNGGRVIAVGTTVTRTLEFASDKIMQYSSKEAIRGEADIFIYPGYSFLLVDGLLTNFHAPRSSVLMMASAFANWSTLKNAYQHAIAKDYRFLSYGDSMLIL